MPRRSEEDLGLSRQANSTIFYNSTGEAGSKFEPKKQNNGNKTNEFL